MKLLPKLFLLSVLGLGVYVHETFADATVDSQIYAIVEQSLSGKKLDINSLPTVLTTMKERVSNLIKDNPEYTKLKEALKNFDTSSAIAAYMQLTKVLSHAPEKTQKLIKEKLKAHGIAC